jgi:predicted branched-subunit amino acid permease
VTALDAPEDPALPDDPAVLAAAVPVAAAIGVLGVVYGAVAQPILGPGLTVASSVAAFSGAAQFAMVGLLASGGSAAAVLASVIPLALRHLPLGAILRPRLRCGRARRALLSWFLTDETVGLALTRRPPAERTVLLSGAAAYAAWVAGTVAGVAGASLGAIAPLAEAVFPVLFIGLAAVTTRRPRDAILAVVAGTAAAALLLVAPDAGILGGLAVAVLVAAAGGRA